MEGVALVLVFGGFVFYQLVAPEGRKARRDAAAGIARGAAGGDARRGGGRSSSDGSGLGPRAFSDDAMRSGSPAVLYVYKADTGVLKSAASSVLKMFGAKSLNCSLCNLTHGVFSAREAWTSYLAAAPVDLSAPPVLVLHRDEFKRQFPERSCALGLDLPAVLLDAGDGTPLASLLSPADIERFRRVDELIAEVKLLVKRSGVTTA